MRAENKVKAQLSPQEALIYAMVTVAAADRTISEHELARINTMVRELPAFRGLEETWLSREAQNCGKILSKPGGVNSVVSMVVEALPPGLRETAYALAAEVAASDLAIKDDERDFLALLAEGLGIDPLVRAALERGAHARHRPV
ncbi:MAG TPA: tellurite resistance TerB family protein [Hyphomicrobium sp.]